MSGEFRRTLGKTIVSELVKEPLFRNKLLKDIKKGDVFPAIRNNEIDFYSGGGRIFKYTGKGTFSTHLKYVVTPKKGEEYFTSEELKECKLIHDFEANYETIKRNCKKHSGDEAKGVASLMKKGSFAHKNAGNIIVLDIESSFKSLKEGNSQDRIDILLFNIEKKQLRFIEAKHISNSEIVASKKTTPEVISQIERYEAQVKDKKDDILKAYKNYNIIMNSLFDLEMPAPESIDKHVALLILGFDADQKKGRLKNVIANPAIKEKGLHYYAVGKIDKPEQVKTLWNET